MEAFFSRIDSADYRAQVTLTAAAANRDAAAAAATRPPAPPKRPVGRPKRERDAAATLSAASAETRSKKQRGSGSRGEYTDWFSSPYINDILREYRRCGNSARAAVERLQTQAPDDRYARLSHSSIIGWFDKEHNLLPRFQAHLESGLENVRQNGPVRAFEEHPALEEEIKDTLLRMREAGTAINSHVICWVMRGIITLRAPDTTLHVGRRYACHWARTQLKWSWRKSTTAASKLPLDWEEQGLLMAKRMAATMEMKKVSLGRLAKSCHSADLPAPLLVLTDSPVSHHQHGSDRCASGPCQQLDL